VGMADPPLVRFREPDALTNLWRFAALLEVSPAWATRVPCGGIERGTDVQTRGPVTRI